ncbi:PREDICTED: homeobox protein Nkx-2.8 [Galeopterus variegatus]|uniref:Homeobox protein Nkx-2.8 n=1 Tax=Galeopterus variegatus TaxID=482537 RepID=A0ABM0QDY4_GALVR|nr:PREDICTED: homeobox protein Nkx-2.8 [Galeopterus variegatus]
MATSARLGFTVRRLLDLPEQEAQHLPRREPEPRAPRPDLCATWLESERGHYPSSDESSPEASPPASSQRPSARPASPGSEAEKRKKRRPSWKHKRGTFFKIRAPIFPRPPTPELDFFLSLICIFFK